MGTGMGMATDIVEMAGDKDKLLFRAALWRMQRTNQIIVEFGGQHYTLNCRCVDSTASTASSLRVCDSRRQNVSINALASHCISRHLRVRCFSLTNRPLTVSRQPRKDRPIASSSYFLLFATSRR